jgi:MTH538 TIR-like domain (DUF1863)
MPKRVYFAFHYQDVIEFRANVVRKHNALQGVEKAGYYDHSIWEDFKRQGPIALKRLINKELDGTSVTAVLIGSGTFSRRWVRYEILKSIERGNRVLGIHINGVAGADQKTKPLGSNPFLWLSLTIGAQGTQASPGVWDGSHWITYPDIAPFSVGERPRTEWGQTYQLSHWLRTYDWAADKGYENFSGWIS